jgi:hypothetical protein
MAISHREQKRAEVDEEFESAEMQCHAVDGKMEENVTSSQLLSLVLGETLHRGRVDATDLIEVLRSWRRELKSVEFDSLLCQAMVSKVLHHRLGCDPESFPQQMLKEVAEVLWNDPDSKTRLTRLWTALDQQA